MGRRREEGDGKHVQGRTAGGGGGNAWLGAVLFFRAVFGLVHQMVSGKGRFCTLFIFVSSFDLFGLFF